MAASKRRKRFSSAFLLFIMMFFAAVVIWNVMPEKEYSPSPSREENAPSFAENEVPEKYLSIYREAENEYGVSWEVLAAVHRVETVFSTMDELESPVGAVGHTQFMPCSFIGWSYEGCQGKGDIDVSREALTDTAAIEEHGGYGVDADNSGKADPYNMKDAVFSTANYLAANGAADGSLRDALFQYNQADWYVEKVLSFSDAYENNHKPVSLPDAES
ncbi:lytic transglycosylase domain-containing protein [Salibacterium lacus]|uniref:Lytic transglycosylase domain-containing protein n=1 Tax=Salibacterium lacus TaxID=1898109 RepID=A0ABW5SXA9_9BACI